MYYIGIDLGGTNIAVGLVDENGELVSKKSVPTPVAQGEDAIIATIAEVTRDVVKENGKTMDDIKSIGIGSPGSVDVDRGVVIYACNLGFTDTPIIEKLKKYLDKPLFIDNDANCAAWGEAKVGASKGTHSSVMVTLGTGVGGGIIIDDKIVSGFNYFGGELGHIIIDVDGRECGCGRKGCWEAYSSATSLIKLTEEYANEDKASYIWQVVREQGKFSGRTSFDAAKAGDKTAQAVVDYYLKHLAIGIFNMIMIFQPEIVVVGGGISNEGDSLFVPLKKMVDDMSYQNCSVEKEKRTRVSKASLGGDAGIVGAALLGI